MAKSGLRLFGAPVHAMAVHFPLALLTLSPLWDLVALWQGQDKWWQWSFFNLALGLASAAPAIVAGLWDYAALPEEGPAQKMATWHLGIMLGALSVFGIGLVVRGGLVPASALTRVASLLIDGLGAGVMALGGYFGGELTFGLGVGHREK